MGLMCIFWETSPAFSETLVKLSLFILLIILYKQLFSMNTGKIAVFIPGKITGK